MVQTLGRLFQGNLVPKLAHIERGMTTFDFSEIGSIYFESSLPSGIRRPIQSLLAYISSALPFVVDDVHTGRFWVADVGVRRAPISLNETLSKKRNTRPLALPRRRRHRGLGRPYVFCESHSVDLRPARMNLLLNCHLGLFRKE